MKKQLLFMGALAALALAAPGFSTPAQATGLNVTQTAGVHAGGTADAGVQLGSDAMDEDTGLNLDTQAGLKAGAAVNPETEAQVEPSSGDAAQGSAPDSAADSAPDSTIVTTDDDAHVTTDDNADIKLHGTVNTNMPQLNGKAGGGLDAKVSR